MRFRIALIALLFGIPAQAQQYSPNQIAVTCGASSTLLLAAGSANAFIRVSVPIGGNTVGFRWDGAAATLTPPAETVAGGGFYLWDKFLPTGPINCIGSASQAVTVVYK